MLLNKYTLPAERERGCVFADKFENAAEVVRNGGTITGTPSFDNGIVLDGSTDYVTYALRGELNSSTLSFVIEFTPDFASDDGVDHYLNDSTSQNNYVGRKNSSDQLVIRLGGSTIAVIAQGTYGAYWNVGERNILVVTSTTEDTSAWLNGNQILTNDASAWTPTNDTTMTLGASIVGSLPFAGTIHRHFIFNKQLTDQEALDYSNGGGFWNYQNEAVLDCPMGLAEHDPTNGQTLDLSSSGLNPQFGAGGAEPVKKTDDLGYTYDGVAEMSIADNVLLDFGTDDFTVAYMMKSATSASDDIVSKRNGTNATAGFMCGTTAAGAIYAEIDDGSTAEKAVTGNQIVVDGQWHRCVVRFDRDGKINSYVDGVLDKEGQALGTVGSIDNAIAFYLGRNGDGSRDYVGDLGRVKIWRSALTPMQIADDSIRAFKSINTL